jgi:hypothetical protein
MPYINGRLWDPMTESWFEEGAADACTKTHDQRKYVESYASKVVLAAMCPHTELWQKKISSIVEQLASQYGVSGVYIDQICAAPPNLCFDRTHGHKSGGGDFWVRGYEVLLAQAKDKGKHGNPELALTTEDAAECFGAQIDAFLMCNSTRPSLVPLFPVVYSGIFLTFGRYLFEEDMIDPTSFRTKLAQMFVWGAQLCWMPPAFILAEQNAKDAAFLRELAQVKAKNQQYLTFGELIRPPQIENELPVVKTKWCMWNPDADFAIQPLMDITMTAVQASAWQHARDGRYGLFFVNVTEEIQDVEWAFDTDSPNSQWQAHLQGSGVTGAVHHSNGRISGQISIPALGARVVELSKVP